mmetsp:Transcript_14147/g.27123  ORF Transcript_14147/g.27123 Transcript_14147/m.27123 type:complete len:644 (+) Transcript_14147:113-2044(+)
MASFPESSHEALHALLFHKSLGASFSPQGSALALSARESSKVLYAHAATVGATANTQILPELFTEGFDAEQVWQQISLQYTPLLRNARRMLRTLPRQAETPDLAEFFKDSAPSASAQSVEDDDTGEQGGASERDLAAAIQKLHSEGVSRKDQEDFDEDDDPDEDSDGDDDVSDADQEMHDVPVNDEDLADAPNPRKTRKSSVEDDFLILDDMERFVREGEKDAMRADGDGDDDSSNDEEEEEGDQESGDSDLDDDDARADEDSLQDALVFTSAGGEDADGDKRKSKSKNQKHKLQQSNGKGSNAPGDHGWDDEESDEEKALEAELDAELERSADEDADAYTSTHEKRKEKFARQIGQLESQAMAETPWKMAGEVVAKARPKNSVLEADLDFEHVMLPAPVLTEERTQSIEDMIKERVVKQLFNNRVHVEPAAQLDKKDKVELDDTKSKKGLGESYTEEFMNARDAVEGVEKEESELHREVRALWKALGVRLDALSHFQFAPKPVVEEMSITNRVPALQLEEVAPLATTAASEAAPIRIFKGGQEHGKKAAGNVKGQSEFEKADRKRNRAGCKRAVQHMESQLHQKKSKSLAAKGLDASDVLSVQKAKRAGADITSSVSSKFTKSGQMFGALQDARGATGTPQG